MGLKSLRESTASLAGPERIQRLLHFLEILPGEERLTFLALAATFFHGVSSIYLFSTSHALFLAHFAAEELPFTYIGGAVTVLLVGAVYSSLQHRVSPVRLVVGTLIALLVTIIGAWLWLLMGDPKWPAAFLAVWTVAYTTLTYMALWGLFGRVFDTRQAKRLFGLIGAGEFAADILSGFVTPLFVKLIGAIHLLLVAALGLFLMTLFAALLGKGDRAPAGAASPTEPAATSLKGMFADRYPLLLHLVWGLSLMTFYLMDTAFSNQLENHYRDSVDGMTSFLGVFFAVGSGVNMIIETFLTGRVLNRIGILKALFILPVGVLLGCLALSASQFVVPRVGLTVFVLAVGVKMFDYVVRNAIHDPAFQVLYQPLPPAKRFAVQSSVLTRAESTAALIGGGSLLLARFYFEIDAVNIAWIISLILAIQIAMTVFVRGQYLQSLLDALKTRRFDPDKTSLYDRPGIDLLMGWLESRHPGEVIYALRLMEKSAPDVLSRRLPDLLSHASEEVQTCALEGIVRLAPANARDRIAALVGDDRLSGAIRGKALLAYCALDDAGAAGLAQDLLSSDDPALRRSALVGLLRYGGIEGILVGGESLTGMLRSAAAAERAEAAAIIGDSGLPPFYRQVRSLLQDEAEPVVRAALRAAEKLGHPRLIPALLPHLANPRRRFAALRAIAAVGDEALAELAFALPSVHNPQVAQGILRAVSRNPSPQATAFLVEHLFYPDGEARRLILAKLKARGYQAQGEEEKTLLHSLIRQEGAFCAWVLGCQKALAAAPGKGLQEALAREYSAGLMRLLDVVSFLCPSQAIRAVQRHLDGDQARRANALEMLDSLLPDDLRKLIHPLVEDLSLEQRLGHLGRQFSLPALDERGALATIVTKEEGWLGAWPRALALYALTERGEPEWEGVIETALTSPEAMVRETAQWVRQGRSAGGTRR